MPNDSATVRMAHREVVDAALAGLQRTPKTLPAKLFYDDEGCRLFTQITELPEYYLTRTERSLLRTVAPQIARLLPHNAALIEYGASDETKAEFLLSQGDTAGEPMIKAYVPIDVAAPGLEQMQVRLRRSRPYLQVRPLLADFMDALSLPRDLTELFALGFFPGSTIGNLDPGAAATFLRQARQMLGRHSRFVVGVDLRKDPAILLPAYDDAAGVTAAFNRNVLVRLNREAEANFDLMEFEHRAIWNDAASRIEMHLECMRDTAVRVGGHTISFERGETIHTENSYKYTPEGFASLALRGGWQAVELWIDRDRLFSIHLLEPGRGL